MWFLNEPNEHFYNVLPTYCEHLKKSKPCLKRYPFFHITSYFKVFFLLQLRTFWLCIVEHYVCEYTSISIIRAPKNASRWGHVNMKQLFEMDYSYAFNRFLFRTAESWAVCPTSRCIFSTKPSALKIFDLRSRRDEILLLSSIKPSRSRWIECFKVMDTSKSNISRVSCRTLLSFISS